MTTEIYKRVLYNDGEAQTYGDANDAQDFIRATIWDKIIQNLIGNTKLTGASLLEFGGNNGVDAPNHLAYCLHGGQAYLRPGSATNKVQIAPGVLIQKVGTTDGSAPSVLAYAFAGTEEFTLTNGDATNPRIDLLQMKLEFVDGDSQSRDFQDAVTGANTSTSMNKKRFIQCTLSVKAGAAAANPTYPDPDAGYVAVGGALVGPGYVTSQQAFWGTPASANTALSSDITGEVFIHDQRMPLNIQSFSVDPSMMRLVTAWTNNGDHVTSSNAVNQLNVPNPKGGNTSRLVGIEFYCGSFNNDTTNDVLVRMDPVTTDIMNYITGISGGGIIRIPYYTLEGQNSQTYKKTAAFFTINPSSVNKIGVPIWSNGGTSPFQYCQVAGSGPFIFPEGKLHLQLKSGQNASSLYNFNWLWAVGI